MNKLYSKFSYLLGLGIFILIIAVFVYLFINKKPVNNNTKSNPNQVIFKNITPGLSDQKDLEKNLGKPSDVKIDGNEIINLYKVDKDLRMDSAIISNNKVIFIKQIVSPENPVKADQFTQKYGKSTEILYENSPNSVFSLYTYPQNGFAFLGAEDGTLLEIWYFIPTTFENFKKTWGQGYLTKPLEFKDNNNEVFY